MDQANYLPLNSEQSERLTLYTRLIEEANLAQSEAEVFQIAARYSAQILQVDRCSIALLDETGEYFDIVALDGQTGAIPLGIKLPRKGTLLGVVVDRQEVIIENDAFQTDYLDLVKLREHGAAFMDAPLISGGQVIGTLNSMRKEAGSFSEEDRMLILQVSALLASNIEGRRLFEQVQKNLIETERHARRQQRLNDMAKKLEFARSPSEIYRIATESIPLLLPAKRVSIALLSEDQQSFHLVATNGQDDFLPTGTKIPMANTAVGLAISQRKILNTPDFLEEDLDELKDIARLSEQNLRSCIAAPLSIEDRVIGTINIAHDVPHTYSMDDEILLYHISTFVAVTLDNLKKSAELNQRAEELSAKNDELTRMLQALDERAIELRKTLEENKEILGITAHDLKNPLGGIIGLADLINEELDPLIDASTCDATDNIRLIKQEAQRMLFIIQDMLDRHRDEYEEEARYEPTDLSACARTVIRWNEQQADTKNMVLFFSGPGQAMASVNATAIERAMDNFISNAVKYSPNGSRIKVEIQPSEADEAWKFSVTDQGPGLTPEDKEKAFGKMRRLSATPTGGEHSTGLGLYIVKQVVEQHQGQVGIDSEIGQGATFWFTLPASCEFAHTMT